MLCEGLQSFETSNKFTRTVFSNKRTFVCLEKSTFWHQASDGSYSTHWFSCSLITHALRGILILTKNWKIRTQTTQNKCVKFCRSLDKMADISQNELEKLKWLPISDSINQRVFSTSFKFISVGYWKQ